ncbi:MAG: tyrosine-type recombinase/integrase [Deltaproteobacteria bacterium]|jgi:integrase/recombinase XerC|nr:tyrosine-type recombinase/integrase [Deltaproteobacteria bacterium]
MRTIKAANAIPKDHWLRGFHERLISEDLSPVTVRGYLYDLNHFRNWLTESHGREPALEQILTVDLTTYRQYMVDVKHLKASSVNRRIQAVKKLFSWAHTEGLVVKNPAKNVRFMKPSVRYRPKALRKKELHALLRVAGQSSHGLAKRNYALIQLMVQTGLRISEAAAVKIADLTIHERSGSIRVCDANGRKEREIPLNAAVRRAFTTYLSTSRSHDPDDYLFFSKRNQPASIRTLQDTIARLARKARVKRIRVSAHTLRHTFAINYLKSHPGKLMELAALLGNESLDTVAVYTRPCQETLALDPE